MTEQEIIDWEREITHAEKMQEQLRDKKIEKANALMASLQNPKKHMTYEVKDTKVKSTDENLFACEYCSEHQASLSLEQNKKCVARPYRAQERSLNNSVENIRGDVMRARSARQQDMDDTIQACIYNIKRRNLDNKIKDGLDDGLPAIKTINKESGHKQSVNQQFWHSMKEIIFVIVCAAIVIYTLIHFA